jgi:WXG100 family type VII secretion target
MNDPDDLVYDFAGIDTITASINTFVADMNANLAEVDKTFQDMLDVGWSGQGSDKFYPCKVRWHNNADALNATLQDLAKKVGNAAANMAAADAAAAAKF